MTRPLPKKLALITLHDVTPTFSKRVFEYIDAFDSLEIKFNLGLVPFFHHSQNLTSFPDFVDKLKSYKQGETALHGLYHEDRNGQMDDFHTITKASAEEELRRGNISGARNKIKGFCATTVED